MFRGLLVTICLLIFLAVGGQSWAQSGAQKPLNPAASRSVKQGLKALQGKDYAAALKAFKTAHRFSKHPGLLIHMAVAANRLGRHTLALVNLRTAERAGLKSSRIDFEMGWAAVALGGFRLALQRLQRFEKAKPGSAKTAEFLGRAYLGMGDLNRAETHFQLALKRDPGTKPTVTLALAVIAKARGNQAAAEMHLAEARRLLPRSPLTQRLADMVDLPPVDAAKPWSFGVRAIFGYDNNVLSLGDSVAVPTDISSRDAFFLNAGFGASYVWRPSATDRVTASYGIGGSFYESGLSALNQVSQNVGLN